MDVVVKSSKRGKGGGSKKYGRNERKCQQYRLENRRAKSKARKAVRNAKREQRLAARRERRMAA